MALLCCHNQIQFHLRPCQKGTSVVQTRKLGDRSMTSLQQLCHPPQIHGQNLKAIQRWNGLSSSLTLTTCCTWTVERWGPTHSHSLVSVYKAPFQLYHLSDVWMHQTSCFKIIPANQPSEASLERRWQCIPGPKFSSSGGGIVSHFEIAHLGATPTGTHNDCKLTHTNKTKIWFYILTIERTIICKSIQTYTFKLHLNCRKCVAQKTQTVYTPKALFCY